MNITLLYWILFALFLAIGFIITMSDNRRRIKLVLALTARLAGIEAALFLIWTTGALDNYLIARFFPWSIGLSLFILALCYFFGCIARNNTPAVETPDR